MKLYDPQFRTDYVGETINKIVDGETTSYFVAPRENVFVVPQTDAAIVLGNGITKNSKEVQQLLRVNSNKVSESYKLVYACNRAISDEANYDYYVLKHRVFLGEMPANRKSQVYLPYDIFLDYKDDCNLIPYISQFDSGASAAYLACFDGHKKVFLMGFDGDLGAGWQTAYDGSFPYDYKGDIDMTTWQYAMYHVMNAYTDTEFYRVQLDGQTAPDLWRSLPNFRDVTVRQAVLLGDF